MRIAFIMPQFPKLSETFILNQITGLIDRGHYVDIFARRNSNEALVHPDVLKYNLLARTYYLKFSKNKISRSLTAIQAIFTGITKHPKITLRSLNIFRYGRAALSFQLLLSTAPFIKNYNIIHCHYGPTGKFGVTLKEVGIKAKLVTTFHGFDIRLGIKNGGHIYHTLFDKGDCFISISPYNYNKLVAFGLDERKIVDLPVGIDLTKFSVNPKPKNLSLDKPFRILTVARLVEEKGLKYGIQAIYKLLQQWPQYDLKYTIIGEGPLKEELEKLTGELMLKDFVHFIGAKDQRNVIGQLQESHIFFLPSVAEVLPVSIMEAQAAGLPVVATNVGDIDNIVLDGKSGFVVPSKNVDALVDKLKYLIMHPERRSEMGLAGRKYIEKNYDRNRLNDRLVEIYQGLLN